VDDVAIPGDYDGDGRSDFCVVRAPLGVGIWYILERDGGGTGANPISFGSLLTDVPAPGDYDGDGRQDIAIWRDGVFWVRNSSFGNATQTFQWGQAGDVPLAGWNIAGFDF
jgi:hypothetical protein